VKIQTIAGLAFFVLGVGFALRTNKLFGDIVADINRLRPMEKAIPVNGFIRHRFFSILMEYRKLYPDGRLHSRVYISSGIGFACWLAFVGLVFP
jgi:hypothetical protein